MGYRIKIKSIKFLPYLTIPAGALAIYTLLKRRRSNMSKLKLYGYIYKIKPEKSTEKISIET